MFIKERLKDSHIILILGSVPEDLTNNLPENWKEFNKNYMLIKLKYLGKLDKMINQLETQKIILKLSNEEWQIKIL